MPNLMKCRCAFLASLVSSFAALLLIHAARHQLALAVHFDGKRHPFEHFQRGTLLLYSAWIFAFGSAEFLWQSHRNQEQESAWPVEVFFYLGVVP